MYQRVMVLVDGSEGARRALEEAVKLARVTHADVQAVFVVEHRSQLVDIGGGFAEQARPNDPASEAATLALDEARTRFTATGVQGSVRAIDSYGESVATVLLRALDEFDADVVVMHADERGGLRRLFAGSVVEALLRETAVPLLLLRNGEE
ncbi:universal stress protein [Trinickia fusca]|uniref:Universal stress protein n=1 Tax=Trinickia fusca TaxID=2419777 RepID=A0A494X8V9_9BURK|nr:universal stress protein [Trinickia fusca]RKP44624.1 universal stress protein [Trinickia fusca]